MVRVFVTGASGFIGEATSLALRRAGHQVFGLVRDIKKASTLLQNEIKVLVGDISKEATYVGKPEFENAQVIIHTAVDYAQFAAVDGAFVKAVLQHKNKPRFIYTSGVLVYPSDSKTVQDEDSALDRKHPFFGLRIAHEDQVLAAKGVVVRPGFVYGGKAGHFTDFFNQAIKGNNISVPYFNQTWSEVHIDDLADLYVKITEAPSAVVAGEAFNGTDSSRYSNQAIALALARAVNPEAKIVPSEQGALGPLGEKSVLVSSAKAGRLLNWHPKRALLLDEVDFLLLGHLARNPALEEAYKARK